MPNPYRHPFRYPFYSYHCFLRAIMNRFLCTMAFALLPAIMAAPTMTAAQTPSPSQAHSQGSPSPYAGLQNRDIKSLSADDLADLRKGAGWGLALAAELNGVPGPAHLLELREQIGLSPEQVAAIETIYAQMQAQAIVAGERLIAAEAAIEARFREGNLSPEVLRELIDESAAARAELRYVHLLRHLETPPLLTAQQIARYNTLRGYDSNNDPCAFVPEGHNPTMWRRHNNCTN
jgi:hypothetical protein